MFAGKSLTQTTPLYYSAFLQATGSDMESALLKLENIVLTFKKYGLVVNASKASLAFFLTARRAIHVESFQLC